MAMPCSHPDLFIDDWLDLVWSNGRGDEFDISFGDYEEEVWNMTYYPSKTAGLHEQGRGEQRGIIEPLPLINMVI